MRFLDRLLNRKQEPRQVRRYDAATPARTRFNAGQNRFSSYGPETIAANPTIRSRARHAAENNALAVSAIAAWIDATIGAGMIPTSQHPDAATRKALDSYFSKWAKHADIGGRGDFWALQAAAVRSQRIDGEAFMLWRGEKLLHLPPEQLADLTTDSVAAGVELNDNGAAIAYHVHPIRPDGVVL